MTRKSYRKPSASLEDPGMIGQDPTEGDPWARLEVLVERAPSLEDLHYHRLDGFAARKWRAEGRPLPPRILAEERFAPVAALASRLTLSRILEAFSDPVIVLKGPEVACHYPDPALRPYHDLDLLVEDSAGAHRALVAAGCTVMGNRPSPHHELPLAFPDLPVMVELHKSPKWPLWGTAPSTSELFAAAVPSAWAEGQALAPSPAHRRRGNDGERG
jgi:hypothetical protein